MSEGVRKTISNAGIYGFGTVIQQSVSFIMLPIYTHYLTPADYGVASLLNVATGLAGLVMGLQLTSGLFRFYFAQDSEQERRAVICTALCGAVTMKSLAVLLLVLFATPVSGLLFDSETYSGLLALFSLTLVTNVLVEVPLQYLRALERAKLFVAVSVARLVLQLSLNILFVVILEYGVLGVVLSSVISGFIMGLTLSAWLLAKTGLGFKFEVLKKLANYSWPLVIGGIISLYCASAARISLTHFRGLGEVGLLALALKLAEMVRLLVLNPFMQAWEAQQFQLLKQENSIPIYQRAFRLLVMLVYCAGGGILLVAPEVLEVMSDEKFWSAAKLVPLCVFSTIILSMSPFCRFGVMVSGRTMETARGALLAAVAISLVAILLVPMFGAQGAAFAGVAGPAANLWWMNRESVKDFDMRLQWSKFWMAGVIVFSVYFCSLAVVQPLMISLAIKLLLWVIMVAALFYSPVLTAEDRKSVWDMARGVLNWTVSEISRRSAVKD